MVVEGPNHQHHLLNWSDQTLPWLIIIVMPALLHFGSGAFDACKNFLFKVGKCILHPFFARSSGDKFLKVAKISGVFNSCLCTHFVKFCVCWQNIFCLTQWNPVKRLREDQAIRGILTTTPASETIEKVIFFTFQIFLTHLLTIGPGWSDPLPNKNTQMILKWEVSII